PNCRSIRNFPVQANAAEMLRLAVAYASERNVTICAPVHDAVLIEASTNAIDEAITTMQAAMAWASKLVLSGFELRTEDDVIHYPDRFMYEKVTAMWWRVQAMLPRNLTSPGQTTSPLPCQNQANPLVIFW